MKNIKNANGFTLIELLAVIVVLAIVILMASMAVIPRMNEARRQVFAMEANEAINAASSYLMDGAITGGKTFPASEGSVICMTISELVTNGDFKNKGYQGRILVKKSGNDYLYVVTMTNEKLIVKNAGSGEDYTTSTDITAENVVDYNKTADEGNLACPPTPTASDWPKK